MWGWTSNVFITKQKKKTKFGTWTQTRLIYKIENCAPSQKKSKHTALLKSPKKYKLMKMNNFSFFVQV